MSNNRSWLLIAEYVTVAGSVIGSAIAVFFPAGHLWASTRFAFSVAEPDESPPVRTTDSAQ
jgi:hypothetical protein